MTPSFRGIFLTFRDSEKTARFYQDIGLLGFEKVGEPGQYVYWKLDYREKWRLPHDSRWLRRGAPYPALPVQEPAIAMQLGTVGRSHRFNLRS
jgi:hypothetical protein